MTFQLFKAVLTAHDFFFFASFDYKIGFTQDAIHNYAIMYALWNKARFASAYIPHYLEDLPTMEFYATPARPIGSSDFRVWKNYKHTHFDTLKVTYNSLTEISASKMEQSATTNIPINSSYYKFRPLTSYEFYILSEYQPKRLIRIGKKFSIAELQLQGIDSFSKKHGRHSPDHFVNVSDIPQGSRFLEGTFIHGFPTPLVTDAIIESDYMEIEDSKRTIQLPNTKLYPVLENFG
jgi:CRISPR type I-D-associated protein Csc1